MSNLLVPIGIPGCGKSTWAETFFDLKYAVVSSDRIRKHVFGSLKAAHDPEVKKEANAKVFREFHRKIEDNLTHNIDTIADATNLSRSARDKLVVIARAKDAKVHAILFKNLFQAEWRNAARDEDARVPGPVMDNMTTKYYDTLATLLQEDFDTMTTIESFA